MTPIVISLNDVLNGFIIGFAIVVLSMIIKYAFSKEEKDEK